MKPETINPFGIYLDLDCVTHIEEATDKWELALRLIVTVNKIDYDTLRNFLKKTLINSVSQYVRKRVRLKFY
jgi:hypothetical protein